MSSKTKYAFILSFIVLVICSSVNAAVNCSAESGQSFINEGRYDKAINEFTCVINGDPTAVEGYRGRIEAKVLLERYSDAVLDYQRVMALVVPVHPDAKATILAHYDSRLANDPLNVRALTGKAFARWWFFDYAQALQVLSSLIAVQPNGLFPNLFRGSSRLLSHSTKAKGVADLEKALAIAPANPHVRFIVADAYTYGGLPDSQRAFDEALLALNWGLDTPRVHAILGASYNAFGDLSAAAEEIETSIDIVTSELVPALPLTAGSTQNLWLVPGRVYVVPVPVVAGQTISVATSSKDMWDTILVLLGPNGTPVLGADDVNAYFAAFDYVAPTTGTYTMKVTSFESIATGSLTIMRN